MQSKTNGLTLKVRQWLQIDGWGKDMYRVKRRLSRLWQEHEEILDMWLETQRELNELKLKVKALEGQTAAERRLRANGYSSPEQVVDAEQLHLNI